MYNRQLPVAICLPAIKRKTGVERMKPKVKVLVGILTALAMMLLTFALPRGGMIRDEAVVLFPTTVGIWAIFVLLFVKLT